MTTQVARVGDIADQVRGVTYSKSEGSSEPRDGYVPIVRAGNLSEGRLTLNDLVYVPAQRVSDKQKLRRHDVVVATSSGSLDVVGKAAAATNDLEVGFGAFCKVLRPSGGVHPRYFAHFFQTPAYRSRMSRAAAGANINNLRARDLNDLEIPLPPIEEQRRIAATLDKADALRTKRQTALALTDSLNQSVFLGMFGDPASNPREWPTAPLGALCTIVGEYGAAVPSAPLLDGGPRYVRITDIGADGYLTDGAVGPAGAAKEWSRYTLEPGDLLFARSGATVGKTYLHGPTEREHVFAGYLIRFRPDPRQVNPVFLFHFTRSSAYRKWVENKQRAVAQPNINAKQYGSELMIPLPPLELQQDFATRIRLVAKHRSALGGSSSALGALVSSLQHRAFSGQL